MPPTNDLNESILGVFRRFMRAKPGTSLHMFNAQLKCQNNGTEAFMENFDEADHAHLRQVARKLDASGFENQRQAKLTEYAQKKKLMRKWRK